MERSQGRVDAGSGRSARSTAASGGSAREIEEDPSEEKVYVAVQAEFEAGKANLLWAVRNFSSDTKIVITHVHRPAKMINMLGGMFPVNTLEPQQVNEHRRTESVKMHKSLDYYVSACLRLKAKAEKLVIEMDDIAKGLLELIARHRITKLVMGAAADKHYSERLKSPRSRKARGIRKHADQSCQIWFVCKGNLIFTRDGKLTPSGVVQSSMARSSTYSQAENFSSRSCSRSTSSNSGSSLLREEESDMGLSMSTSVHELEEDLQLPSPHPETEDSDLDADIYHRLQTALKEVGGLEKKAYEESRRRQKAEMDLGWALEKAKEFERKHAKEVTHRKQVEETLKHQHEISDQLQNRIADLEDKLSLHQSLQEDYDVLQHERDSVVQEVLNLKREQMLIGTHGELNSKFPYSELQQATDNFNSSREIGKGGFGIVYKGFLRNTTVAIKILHPESLQGQEEFHQEVAILSRVRHPNLVTLIGACPQALALVYEYLPNGSLEDRLLRANDSPPLTWQARTRVTAEICSALIFLHMSKPHTVVHGDLKPANILLDANLVSKLSDFGISRLLIQSNTGSTLLHNTLPKGTFVYMDPELVCTGNLTPQSDVYSFGVTILQLLTGRPALGIARVVKEALDQGNLDEIIDPTAGNWPFVQAKHLARLGLRCCEMKRQSRPNLAGEVWRVIEPLMKAASLSESPPSFASISDSDSDIPSYFICPIFQEIMRDPHIAADGFTYEAEAIKGWLDSGQTRSPMTNLELCHHGLIPNRALRSTIQEWLQQRQQT